MAIPVCRHRLMEIKCKALRSERIVPNLGIFAPNLGIFAPCCADWSSNVAVGNSARMEYGSIQIMRLRSNAERSPEEIEHLVHGLGELRAPLITT